MVHMGKITLNRVYTVYAWLALALTAVSSHAIVIMEPQANGPDFKMEMKLRYKPEGFFAKNYSLLNDANAADKVFFLRHTLDVSFDWIYGLYAYEHPVMEFFIDMRDRGIWGDPETIARTTFSSVKLLDSTFGRHTHSIPRYIFWARELWFEFALGDFFGRDFGNDHTFKLGLFPFQLGRGIALGDAYATGPEFLGYYTDTVVDQYAPGAKFSGVIKRDILNYDAYFALLENKSDSLGNTTAKVRAQEIGHRMCPQRGFGAINFLLAGRLLWTVFDDITLGTLTIEPYALFNDAREQAIEFIADGASKLGTVGFAGEYTGPIWEFGWDYAVNLGRQEVKAWDRNQIKMRNQDSFVVEVNSYVVDQNGNAIPHVPGSEAQRIINAPIGTVCPGDVERENGQIIGVIPDGVGYLPGPVTLINKKNRYRDAYTNRYEGWMFVTDAGFWIHKRDLKFSLTAGYASGDNNPNFDTKDRNYKGFIGLQEFYFGKRVKSAFLMAGAGKVARPLVIPENSVQRPTPFAPTVDTFTNLIFAGASFLWEPRDHSKKVSVNPNFFVYWQDTNIRKFDACAKKLCPPGVVASKFLGGEANIFASCYPLPSLKFFIISAVFFPGQHFRDIKGLPLNDEQVAALDQFDTTGFSGDRVPNIGNDAAVTINIGMQYMF